MHPLSSQYVAVGNASDDDLTSEAEKPAEFDQSRGRGWKFSRQLKLMCTLLVGVNIILSVFSALNLHRAQKLSSCQNQKQNGNYSKTYLNANLKETSIYSPIFDDLDFKPSFRTFNGKLRDNSSIWRQPPSPEVDAAWDYISTEGREVITVSSATLEKSGKDPARCVKAPPSWGEGTDAYVAQIEVFHQIHCLDELRKEIYHDHYYKSPPDELHRSHKSHCIHMLLQSLMCAADVGIVSHNWVHNEHISDPKTRPMPDFDVVKKCRDFDAILDWAREKSVKDLPRKWPLLKYTPGTEIVPGDGYA